MKKIFISMICLLGLLTGSNAQTETELWSGNKTTLSYSERIDITAAQLADAKDGDVIKISATVPPGKEYGFFEVWVGDWSYINGKKEQPRYYPDCHAFTLILTDKILADIKTAGQVTFTGDGFTATKATLISQTEDKLMYTGPYTVGRYDSYMMIPAYQFDGAQAGDYVTVEYSDPQEGFSGGFQTTNGFLEVPDYKDEGVYSETDNTFSLKITAADLDEYKTNGMRFRGAFYTMKNIWLSHRIVVPDGNGGGDNDDDTETAEETILFAGAQPIMSYGRVDIPASKLDKAQEGDVIEVYETLADGVDHGFFEVWAGDWNYIGPKQQPRVYGTAYSLVLSDVAIQKIKEAGQVTFTGDGYTINKIVYKPQPEKKLLYSGPYTVGNYNSMVTLPAFDFLAAKVGDYVITEYTDPLDGFSGGYQRLNEWNEVPDYKDEGVYTQYEDNNLFALKITAADMDEYQTNGMRVRGSYYTLQNVYLVSAETLGNIIGTTSIESNIAVSASSINSKVYNMNGQAVSTNGDLRSLPKGIYIINGKKYVVR